MKFKQVGEGTDDVCPLIDFARKKRGASDCIAVKSLTVDVTRREDNKFEWKDFTCKAADDTKNSPCPLYREYDPAHFLIVHFSPLTPFDAVSKFLKNGVILRFKEDFTEERFVFFGHSASQLRERTCVLYNEKQGSVTEILSHFGNFEKIQDVAKRAARVGLLFSTAKPACSIPEDQIGVVDDVERDNYNFTDGCGFISTKYASKVTESLKLKTLYEGIKFPPIPSVFQIRLKGCKGVLCHNNCLEEGIQIRPSMEKFVWRPSGPHPLGIVDRGFSRPNDFGSLNKQYIMLLSALGISDEVFLKKQEEFFQELKEITTAHEVAFKFLCANEEFELAENLLKTRKIDTKTKQRLEKLRNRVREPQPSKPNPLHKPKKSAALKLKIPIEKSRNVYGVCDPSGQLKARTVFFQPTIRGSPVILTDTRVVVAKNPCYHPGDIRVLQCTDVPECHHLVDCIVFPTQGFRPHPDEIAGSDLDGDKFFVCWDEELVPKKETEPSQYPAAKPAKRTNLTHDDFLKYFAKYSNAVVSKLDNLFDRWADSKGISSAECQIVARLFSRAIDAAKTGERVKITEHISKAPTKDEKNEEFVWQKLYQRAKLFESDQLTEDVVIGKVEDFEEEDMLALLSNQESRLSEYRLFRYLYKWCQQPNKERCIDDYIHLIDFSQFSREQCKRLPADIPMADLESLLHPLHRSRILSRDDITFIKVERGREKRWRLLYRTEGQELSWRVFHNILISSLEKLLVFKFLLGDIQWVISLAMSVPLNLCEVLTLDEEENIAQAFCSVHVQSTKRYVLQLNAGYSFALDGKRLDIYTGKKQNTFICLQEDENYRVPIMSVALNRFNSSLPRDFQTRLRREQLLELEAFCVYDHFDPGHRIQKLSSKKSVRNANATEGDSNLQTPFGSSEKEEEFVYHKGDFPGLQCDHEESLSDLNRNIINVQDLLERGRLQTSHLEEICDRMTSSSDEKEKHHIACHLESVLWRSSPDICLGTPDHYKNLLICLLSGLQELNVDIVLGENVRITLLTRFKRCLESFWKRQVTFSVDQMYEVIDAVLLGNDYPTGRRVVQVIREGYLPLEGFTCHPNALPYFLHWISLITLESLEEVQQAVQASHGVYSRHRVTAQATPYSEQELKFTLVITGGTPSFRSADGVALSRSSNISKREYIGEVTEICGAILTVSIVWPTSSDDSSRKNILKGMWYLYKFPSLVGYRRTSAALKALQDATKYGQNVLKGIVSSFCVDNPSSQDSCEQVDEGCTTKSAPSVARIDGETSTFSSAASFSEWHDGNDSQNAAVQDATCTDASITLIQGPPGSGKTITCAEIVKRWLLRSSDQILLVAETNEGVDNLLKKLLDHVLQHEEIVRFGSSGWKVSKDINHLTFEFKYSQKMSDKKDRNGRIDRKVAKKILESCKIVCTTLISAGSSLLDGFVFKRVLVDEASQATEPANLVSLSHGCEKLVLVGDDKQLPPMVLSEIAKGPDLLTCSMFSRLRKEGVPVRMLNVQYRMHPSIALFPSRQFYDGKLINGVAESERKAPTGFVWPNEK
ncbi:uncharacterized protein LOC111333194 [Stylophora pistillata]|uniref:RNA-dependent RNA polymerase 1 n=1 Tax=Stylophora pistillata TaxID=50429 RepID=A0A2B4S046_STYPI|nr:uncharacterized protein LOC111333194 [Stylophora pistillata]PFX23271.1 RNA-dependent RNA polymerase 1 [Stylophora pistillata]